MPPTLTLDAPVSTSTPQITLPDNLPPGRYQVTLTISGAQGSSLPARLTVIVSERTP